MCECVCECGSVYLSGHIKYGREGGSQRRGRGRILRGGRARTLIAVGNGSSSAVLANERAIRVERDVHAVSVLGQGVVAGQLAGSAQRGAGRTLLIHVTGTGRRVMLIHILTDRMVFILQSP